MTIRFLTLLLGLVWGPREIELSVGPEVAAVRCELDGREVALLEAAPWAFTVDLGVSPTPQRLEAIALDRNGDELERATQLLNVPRPKSGVALDLQIDPSGRTSTAEIVWKSVLAPRPDAVQVRFNDQPVPLLGGSTISLPPYDPLQLQFLQVQVTFDGSSTARAEATFGGTYAEQVRTDLTAVPLILEQDPGELGPDGSLRFRHRGEPTEPQTVEKGEADLVFVRDIGAWGALRWRTDREQQIPDGSVVLVSSVPLERDGVGGQAVLFPTLFDAPFRSPQRRLLFEPLSLLGWQRPRRKDSGQQLHRAVAVAALRAAERNRRRVLVVVLGSPTEELLNPMATTRTRALASELGVPLVVWSIDHAKWMKRDESHGWGEIRSIRSNADRAEAVAEINDLIARQRIAWFEGTHLVKEFALETNPLGLSILE